MIFMWFQVVVPPNMEKITMLVPATAKFERAQTMCARDTAQDEGVQRKDA